MLQTKINKKTARAIRVGVILCLLALPGFAAEKKQGPASTPVRVADVKVAMVSEQVSIIGTTEAIRISTVAAEVSGRVVRLLVKEGDFVQKGAPLVNLSSTDPSLRLKGVIAGSEALKAKLVLAEKELQRVGKLKDANSVAAKQYDEAYFNYAALTNELESSQAKIEQIQYEITRKTVYSPFAGFIAANHTQVGEWMNIGGSVITLVDLSNILIKADLPERYAVKLDPKSRVAVIINSISDAPLWATLKAVMPQGNPVSRTFPCTFSWPTRNTKSKAAWKPRSGLRSVKKKRLFWCPKMQLFLPGINGWFTSSPRARPFLHR